MFLSKNFTLKELTRSNTALRLGINNEPSKEGIYKLTLLATQILQPLRDCLGALRVTSGYRSPELNKALGGSFRTDENGNYVPVSQHCKYEAVDLQYFKRGKMDNIKIYQALKELALPFDQLILEFYDGVDPNRGWVHVSYVSEEANRREALIYNKSGYSFFE